MTHEQNRGKASLLRAWEAISFRADFRMRHWVVEPRDARCWLAAAAVANLLAQLAVGYPSVLSVLGGLVTPAFFWRRPPRLSAGVGALLTVQAIGSVAVVVAASSVGLPKAAVEGCAGAWALYCIAATVGLCLRYIRTPKTQMP